MALKKDIQLSDNFGVQVDFSSAYIRVAKVAGGKNEMTAKVDFCKAEGERVLQSKDYAFAPALDGDNFIAQAYAHLKTLPEFAGAVDC